MKKIAIFCSVYNREKYIEKTILSVLNQSYINFEFLIVDDWSKDNSYEIIEKYYNLDSRIKLWRHENKGLIYEYNFLLNNISDDVEYITWIDSDDLYTKDCLLEKFNYINDNNKDWLICDLQPIDSEWKKLNYDNYFFNSFSKYSLNNLEKILLNIFINGKNLPISYGTIFVKRNILLTNKIINPTSNDKYFIWDFDLIFRLLKLENIWYIDKRLLLYRKHDDQITLVRELQIKKDLIDIFNYFSKENIFSEKICNYIINIINNK